MIELPEGLSRARELNEAVAGKTVLKVFPPSSPHKFCWYNGDVIGYSSLLEGKRLTSAKGFGMFAEMEFEDSIKLCVDDGVNIRLLDEKTAVPKKYQLLIKFTDGCFSV